MVLGWLCLVLVPFQMWLIVDDSGFGVVVFDRGFKSNQHIIFSKDMLINTVTSDDMEWTKPKPEYRHTHVVKQSICYSKDKH